MIVNLSPELERRLLQGVSLGEYTSVDALVAEAVERLLDEVEAEGDLGALRASLREAEAELDRGEGIELDDQGLDAFVRDIHERGLKRLAEMRKTGTEG
jgi:Arc/MetJ-type ribon-helix-helix transcriptional regulator